MKSPKVAKNWKMLKRYRHMNNIIGGFTYRALNGFCIAMSLEAVMIKTKTLMIKELVLNKSNLMQNR